VLDECTLVLEGVTLAQVVELVVEVLVDLASGAVLDEQAAEDTQTTHPHDLTVSNLSEACPSHNTNTLSKMHFLQVQVDCIGVNIRWHPSISGTLPLTETPVPSNSSRLGQLAGPGARVHSDWLADDKAIGDEFADGLAGVGVGDFVDLVRVEPDLALATVGHRRRQALLCAEVHPGEALVLVLKTHGEFEGVIEGLKSRPRGWCGEMLSGRGGRAITSLTANEDTVNHELLLTS
jgi:hypothetical protein